MAANSPSVEFRIPQEPLPVPPVAPSEMPVPFVSSDEESFVVLGKSLVADVDDLSFEAESNFGKSIIQEGKQLIKEELDRIEQKSIQKLTNGALELPSTETVNQNGIGSSLLQQSTSSKSSDQMEKSTTGLPIMPQPLNPREADPNSTSSKSSDQMEKSTGLPDMPQPLNPREADANDTSRTISIISFSPSEFASEELQTKVSQLIDENVHLKETILQNNMSMRAQYEKIVAWQKDVEKVHEAHKEKFRHAKQCIESLKKDNAVLKQDNAMLQQELENLRYSIKLHETEQDKTKQMITQSSENNLKEFELDIANKRIKDLEEAMENMKIKSVDEKSKANWQAMEGKIVKFEAELENSYKKNRELEVLNGEYQEKLKLLEEKSRLTEIAKDQTENEILSLRKQLAKNLQSTEAPAKLEFELQQARNKLVELEELLTQRNANLIDANVRSKKFEDQYLESNEKCKTIEATLANLQGQLEQAKIELWKNKQTLNEKETQLQMMQKDLDASQQEKQKNELAQNYSEITYLRQQLMQSQMALTQCDQNRAVAHAQLEAQKNEIEELRRQLREKESENDAIFALQTQLDVYKADFEAEREAKEEVKRDKNKISEDLQHLHRRNQQLQEEIEILRERNGGLPHNRQESSRSSPSASGWSSGRRTEAPYKCPKCHFGFYTLQAVENHVHRCIDLDESLP